MSTVSASVTSPPRAEQPPRSARLTSLDGLRGIAALVVVVHHCFLTLPGLANENQVPDRASNAWWLTYTPAHLVWAGGEAVLVFFVLSGLVLALPHMRPPRKGTWLPYYVKRSVRLYVPVGAAVALTGVVVTLVPRVADPTRSWWFDAHAVAPQLSVLLHDARLLSGTGWLNSALWSLRYEVLFSILLPVFVVLSRQLVAPLWLSVPMALWGIGWAASIGHELLSYLFVFAVGVLLARGLPTLQGWGDRINALAFGPLAWAVLGVVGLLLLLTEWWMKQYVADVTLWLPVGRPGGVLGAAVLVFCVLHCRSVKALADSRPLQWLGKVSFSLYLVHEPIVVSIAARTPVGLHGLAVTTGLGLVASLLAAVVFFRLVERPSHRLSAWVGRLVTRRQPAPAATAPAVEALSVAEVADVEDLADALTVEFPVQRAEPRSTPVAAADTAERPWVRLPVPRPAPVRPVPPRPVAAGHLDPRSAALPRVPVATGGR